jgi:predicted DNA-binding transcriptional regulator AlpA
VSVYVQFEKLQEYGVHLQRRQLDRLTKRGQFPPKYQLSANRVGYLLTDVQRWVATRPLARSSGQRVGDAAD